jgi:transposase-like protein
MEVAMKSYTEKERLEHLEKWEKGGMTKAEYAKKAGIYPTTFYTWTHKAGRKWKKEFVEINKCELIGETREVVIENGDITIRLPLSVCTQELQRIFEALGNQK